MPFQIFAIFVVQNHSPILLADGTLVFDHRDNLMHVEGPYCDLLKRKHATPFEDLVKEAANAQPEESISCDPPTLAKVFTAITSLKDDMQ